MNFPKITRQWIESLRGPKRQVDPFSANAAISELEPTDRTGNPVKTLTVLLAGSECPLRCTMCDLWQSTLDAPTPPGAIPTQIAQVLHEDADVADWIKLYNASNFFDFRAVPESDWEAISKLVGRFSRVIVENHPRFTDERVIEFANILDSELEIALGLECADDEILEVLNKKATLRDFQNAFELLAKNSIDIRVFVMLGPPGVSHVDCSQDEIIQSCVSSVRWAEQHGARHITIIPARVGNGAMEVLATNNFFRPPTLEMLFHAFRHSLEETSSAVVTVDLWDIERLACTDVSQKRRLCDLMEQMNLTQKNVL